MRTTILFTLVVVLNGCGNEQSPRAEDPVLDKFSIANLVIIDGATPGASPFIENVRLAGRGVSAIDTISYEIEPKPESVSRPVHVSYTLAALRNRGAIQADQSLQLPVFGLYAGYSNAVMIYINFADGSSQTLRYTVTTDAYSDPDGIYDRPNLIKRRDPGSDLGFDFFMMKSMIGTPVIVDTDGNIRWRATGTSNSMSSTFIDNEFVIGAPDSATTYHLGLDGSISSIPLKSTAYRSFAHNLDKGKSAILGELNSSTDIESTIVEFDLAGNVLKEWNLASILREYMTAAGDDADSFVRPGVDWFHSNCAIYDPQDDSLIVSSRENFVIKLDYESGRIIWIFGDPTKYWHTFASLRAKALTLQGAGLYPVGQHGLSITDDGLLMLFNDGLGSLNQPVGQPAGDSRPFSVVSAYQIDGANMTAQNTWQFDHDPLIYSSVCSSVYEAADKSLLVDYANATSGSTARLVGLNADHEVVFDFEYPNDGCSAGWNAIPIAFEQLTFE